MLRVISLKSEMKTEWNREKPRLRIYQNAQALCAPGIQMVCF